MLVHQLLVSTLIPYLTSKSLRSDLVLTAWSKSSGESHLHVNLIFKPLTSFLFSIFHKLCICVFACVMCLLTSLSIHCHTFMPWKPAFVIILVLETLCNLGPWNIFELYFLPRPGECLFDFNTLIIWTSLPTTQIHYQSPPATWGFKYLNQDLYYLIT